MTWNTWRLSKWLRPVRSSEQNRRSARGPRQFRPLVEGLESRLLMTRLNVVLGSTTAYVNTADNQNQLHEEPSSILGPARGATRSLRTDRDGGGGGGTSCG